MKTIPKPNTIQSSMKTSNHLLHRIQHTNKKIKKSIPRVMESSISHKHRKTRMEKKKRRKEKKKKKKNDEIFQEKKKK